MRTDEVVDLPYKPGEEWTGFPLHPSSFEVIKHWPLPVSVAPYFGWKMGALWGLVVGAVSGLVLGFCTDDSHFDEVS